MNALSVLLVTSALGIDFGTSGTIHAHSNITREVVDDWAVRPRLDVIPFADRDRSTAIARRPASTGDLRNNWDSRGSDLTPNRRPLEHLEYPPHFDRSAPTRANSNNNYRTNPPDWSGGQSQTMRNLPPPPDSDWQSTPKLTLPRGSNSKFRQPSHYEEDDRSDISGPDRNLARRERSERWSNSSQMSDSPRSYSPPTASIVETKREVATDSTSRRPISQTSSSVTIISLFLFMSLGGNLYLGWLARDFYWRYRDMAWEVRNQQASKSDLAE